jgi:hypothetical protein
MEYFRFDATPVGPTFASNLATDMFRVRLRPGLVALGGILHLLRAKEPFVLSDYMGHIFCAVWSNAAWRIRFPAGIPVVPAQGARVYFLNRDAPWVEADYEPCAVDVDMSTGAKWCVETASGPMRV